MSPQLNAQCRSGLIKKEQLLELFLFIINLRKDVDLEYVSISINADNQYSKCVNPCVPCYQK